MFIGCLGCQSASRPRPNGWPSVSGSLTFSCNIQTGHDGGQLLNSPLIDQWQHGSEAEAYDCMRLEGDLSVVGVWGEETWEEGRDERGMLWHKRRGISILDMRMDRNSFIHTIR
jgi:hypothetical protein